MKHQISSTSHRITMMASALILMASVSACHKKEPQASAVMLESGSVMVDSISPDSSLVIVTDTTITAAIVPNEEVATTGKCCDGKQCKDKNKCTCSDKDCGTKGCCSKEGCKK